MQKKSGIGKDNSFQMMTESEVVSAPSVSLHIRERQIGKPIQKKKKKGNILHKLCKGTICAKATHDRTIERSRRIAQPTLPPCPKGITCQGDGATHSRLTRGNRREIRSSVALQLLQQTFPPPHPPVWRSRAGTPETLAN